MTVCTRIRQLFQRRFNPHEQTTFMEVPMSRSIVPAGIFAALFATAVTLVLVCVPMSMVWFGAR